MTESREAEAAKTESIKTYPRWYTYAGATVAGALALVAGLNFADRMIAENERDTARTDAEVKGREADAGLWLAQNGITQVVRISGLQDPAIVTLGSTNPDCAPSFVFTGDSLSLSQPDALGRPYGEVVITSAQGAEKALDDLCS